MQNLQHYKSCCEIQFVSGDQGSELGCMKHLRNIKGTLGYFFMAILFTQCTMVTQLYQHHERYIDNSLAIKNLKLNPGDVLRVTTKNNRVTKLIYEYIEGDHIVGHKKRKNPKQIKIAFSDIIEIELIEKDEKTTDRMILHTAIAVLVVGLITMGIVAWINGMSGWTP